jgi:hypothetical protein
MHPLIEVALRQQLIRARATARKSKPRAMAAAAAKRSLITSTPAANAGPRTLSRFC